MLRLWGIESLSRRATRAMKRKLSTAMFFGAVTMLGFAASAGAVDGTIEINQAKVMAAGGFPYLISNPGSYRLTGNLAITSTGAR